MQNSFEARFTGWSFIAAGVLFWGGWMLLPHRIGTYFVPEDFVGVREHLHVWIWIYRVHIFGLVITAIALVALAALVADSQSRIMIWPGAGVAMSGTFVSALAAAFYYHHGAWGAIELDGKGADAAATFVANLRVDTEYVTCLVRFGRVFTGLGLLIVGLGCLKWRLLPAWIGAGAVLIGLAAMALTMGLPDNLALYAPVFHLQALWLLGTGGIIVMHGVRLPRDE